MSKTKANQLKLRKAPEKSGASLCVDELTTKWKLDSIQKLRLEKFAETVNYEKYPSILLDNLTLFSTLYKVYPQKISKLELLRILETVFTNWQSIMTKNFRVIHFHHFIEEGWLEKELDTSESFAFETYGLSEKAYKLVSDFIKEYESPPAFLDPFLAKLICLDNPKNKKDLLFLRDIVRRHRQMICSYIFFNRERYERAFLNESESIDLCKEYFKLDFSIYNTVFEQTSDLLRRINKKLKIEHQTDAYFYNTNEILGSLKIINNQFRRTLGTREEHKETGPAIMLEANLKKQRFIRR